MKLFKKNKNNRNEMGRNRTDEPRQKVISYYTASRRQLDSFERQTRSSSSDATVLRHARTLGSKWFQLLVIIVLFICLLYLSSLNTKPHVVVEGTPYRSPSEYSAAVAKVYGNDIRNRIKPLLMTKNIEESVKQALPEASKVTVSTGFLGHQADVRIVSDEPIAIFTQPNTQDLIMSNHGRLLLSTVDNTKQHLTNLPILQNQTGVEARAGEQFMRPDETKEFGRLIAQYGADKSKPIFSLTTMPHEITAKETGRGTYYARYILDDSIVLQYGALRATEKKLQEIGQNAAEYVDVRLADKAYYK